MKGSPEDARMEALLLLDDAHALLAEPTPRAVETARRQIADAVRRLRA